MGRTLHLERHQEAYERHEAGETYKQIGQSFGVTRERVRQLIQRWKQENNIVYPACGDVVTIRVEGPFGPFLETGVVYRHYHRTKDISIWCEEDGCRYSGRAVEIIREIHTEGTTILLVEQNAHKALAVADRGYVLETGKIVLYGAAEELSNNDKVRKAYLGEE